jgi:choline transport protein
MATPKDIPEGIVETRVVSMVSIPSSSDDDVLKRLGKKPVLRRSFNFITALGFSCTVLITWEASLLSVLTAAFSPS